MPPPPESLVFGRSDGGTITKNDNHPSGGVQAARLAVVVIALIVCGAAVVRRAAKVPIPDTQVAAANAQRLDSGINPNTATPAELTLLPGIGPSKARAIVAYRTRRADPTDPDAAVFPDAESLDAIRGIGPKTIEKLRPWLSFEPIGADQ